MIFMYVTTLVIGVTPQLTCKVHSKIDFLNLILNSANPFNG